jgi:hypothetical protein
MNDRANALSDNVSRRMYLTKLFTCKCFVQILLISGVITSHAPMKHLISRISYILGKLIMICNNNT